MTQVNTILKELRKELGEAMHLVVTSCGDTRCRWEGQRDALIRAIEIVEKAAAPWPAVLEHAPTAELVAALKGREGVEVEELSDNWHEFNITVPTTAIFVERRP